MLQIDCYDYFMNDIDKLLARLDLNLLTALNALLHHQSVSKAAHAVGRTQSAMSHSLSRLRHHFQDALLVRDGWSMKPTPAARNLAPRVANVALAVGALFERPEAFDPQGSNRTIRIATRDICVPLLTTLIAEITTAGPGLSVEVAESTRIRDAVSANEADIGFGFGADEQSATLDVRFVKNMSWCVFAPADHPYVNTPDVETWIKASHILVGSPGHQSGPVEAKVDALGLSRHISCYAPNFTAALGLVAKCNALFTSLKEPFCQNGAPPGLSACPMPFTADLAMPQAPAVLTLRKSWGHPFETWLAELCTGFKIVEKPAV